MILQVPPEDIGLIQALRPYLGARANSLIDTLFEIVGASDQQEGSMSVLETVSVRQRLQGLLANAYNLFLILILLLLSEGELGSNPEVKKTDIPLAEESQDEAAPASEETLA
ncbi:MAG TPA: hypothetical protein GX507_09300 [Clostridia bacterium]|nr:hypothetical protein [Clostridia bacterium]